jgi:hypothetical protein
MGLAGFGFGLLGDQRPFGDGFFSHPLVVLFILVGIALLIVRFAFARPVPAVIPERALLFGCFIALAAFIAGNALSAFVLGVR